MVPALLFVFDIIKDMFVVYLIQHSISFEIYIGFTKNLERRLVSHNSNINRATKRAEGKWILVYAEAYRTERDARVRENKLKQHGSAIHGLKKRIETSWLEDKK